jgi:hypothetical protein
MRPFLVAAALAALCSSALARSDDFNQPGASYGMQGTAPPPESGTTAVRSVGQAPGNRFCLPYVQSDKASFPLRIRASTRRRATSRAR